MADTVIFAEQTITIPFQSGIGEQVITPAPFVLVADETYRVVLDGVEHELVCILSDGALVLSHQVMNESGDDLGDGTFIIAYATSEITGLDSDVVQITVIDSTNTENHTLAIYRMITEDPDYLIKGSTLTAIAEAIRSKTGNTEEIPVLNMAAIISAISSGGGSDGGKVQYKSWSFQPTSISGGYRVAVDFGFKPDILIVVAGSAETQGTGFFGGFGISSKLAEAIGLTRGIGFEQYSNAKTVSMDISAALIDTTGSLYSIPFNNADATGFNIGSSPMSTSSRYYVYAIGWLD